MDYIMAARLKNGGDFTINALIDICNRVWSTRRLENCSDWPTSTNTKEWRFHTLCKLEILYLVIPGKVMSTVLLSRLRAEVDNTRRLNQTGFIPGQWSILLWANLYVKTDSWQMLDLVKANFDDIRWLQRSICLHSQDLRLANCS